MYYLEITCGENQRAALDYLLHYRSPHMIGIDADYAMSRAYRSGGWPRFLVVDAEGIVSFHDFPSDRELTSVRKCLDQLLSRASEASSEEPALDQGIALPSEIIACRQARRDRLPRLAFDQSGNPLVVYYSNRDGTNAVFLRRFNRNGEPREDVQLSAPGVESYGADCVSDVDGTLWVTWCGRQKGLYDIFVQSLPEKGDPIVEHFKSNLDDAMSPRIAAAPDGTISVVYYQWRALRGVSRDRDVFGRRFDPVSRVWQPEVEISPHFPEVEDHTDPDVAFDRQGRAWVVWSYDYHPSLSRKPVDASQPTIFAALTKSATTVSPPILVGATGRYRDAVDLFPSAVVDGQGRLWCAWDCSEPRRCIRLARLDEARSQFEAVGVFGGKDEVCSTPELTLAGTNTLLLTWSSHLMGEPWRGRVEVLKDGQPTAEAVISEPVDVLFPQARQASDGDYWLTYEKCAPTGSEIVLRDVSAELRPHRQSPVIREKQP